MEKVNIFSTQMASDWYRNLLDQAKNDLGYKDQPWSTRAMIAFEKGRMEGRCFTANELELELEQYIGPSENRHSVNNLARQSIRRGIMKHTGRKRRVEGVRNAYPEYEIVGHVEVDSDSGDIRVVRMCEQTDPAR